MTERRLNDRRNWKAETFPYDLYIPDESKDCSVCLTEKQIEILLGIIEPLAWRTRWWSDVGTEIDRFAIEDFRADLSRRLMMACCGDIIIYRYTVDGILQSSSDNGETWEDDPNSDIRTNAPQFPPIAGDDGDDKKCIAATGMADLIHEQIGDNLTDEMTRYTLSQLITDWVTTFIGTSNPFTALLTVITNQIFALVIAVVRPALTDSVYEQLKCIFLNNMSDDATFTSEQWDTIRSEITSRITGVAGIFLEHLVYLLGVAGLTNLARASGATEGDCECDDCTCSTAMWTMFDSNSGIIDEETRTDCGITITAQQREDVNYYIVIGSTDGTQACKLSSVEIIDGSPDFGSTAYTVSPEAFNPTNWAGHVGALPPTTTEITGLLLKNVGSPFTVRLHFD